MQTKRQSDLMDRCFVSGGIARQHGVGVLPDGRYDYEAKNSAAAECARLCGAKPGFESDDAVDAWLEGWDAEDERLHTLKTDLRAYRAQHGDKGLD